MYNIDPSFSLRALCTAVLLLIMTAPLPVRAQSVTAGSPPPSPSSSSVATTIDFDHFATGPVPKEFSSLLGGSGRDASWEIRSEPSALSGRKVLVQTNYDQINYRFPLLLYNNITAKNVRVAVHFKQVSGKVDQAAGVIIRFQNPEHYYVVRANALEDTVQLYRVVNGIRQVIAGVNLHVESGQWHSLEVHAQDENLTVFFDEQQLFNVRDTTFTQAGQIGVSTKSDGVTIFDDLRIAVLDPPNERS